MPILAWSLLELHNYERLENTSKKKFRKVAEDELKEIYKDILNIQLDKSNNVFGMFDKTIDEEIWIIKDKRYKFQNLCDKCNKELTKEIFLTSHITKYWQNII